MDNHWGPKPLRSAPISRAPGKAVGEDSIGAAVEHLHQEHPYPVQGENLQEKACGKIHYPVGSVYKGK